MSTSLTTLVPVLNGTNYTSWAPIMQSFLMSQGQWKVIVNPPPKAIYKKADGSSELLTNEEELKKAMTTGDVTNQQDILDWWDLNAKALGNIHLRLHHTIQYNQRDAITAACQEIGLVAFMFFFELLFFYASLSISFYVSLTNLFSIILFPYLLITRDTQNEGRARFRFY